MGGTVRPSDSQVEALAPNVSECADGAVKQLIKPKQGHKGGTLIRRD